MTLKTTRREFVEEVNYGVYLWEVDGKLVADEDNNFMYISSMRGDQSRIDAIAAAAKSFGIEGGQPVFYSGHRPVTDEEYENQVERMKEGLVPDIFDVPAAVDEMKALKNG